MGQTNDDSCSISRSVHFVTNGLRNTMQRICLHWKIVIQDWGMYWFSEFLTDHSYALGTEEELKRSWLQSVDDIRDLRWIWLDAHISIALTFEVALMRGPCFSTEQNAEDTFSLTKEWWQSSWRNKVADCRTVSFVAVPDLRHRLTIRLSSGCTGSYNDSMSKTTPTAVHCHRRISVKSIPPNTENSLQYGYDENDNNNLSIETNDVSTQDYSIRQTTTRVTVQLTKYNKYTQWRHLHRRLRGAHDTLSSHIARTLWCRVTMHLIGSRSESCHKHHP